MSDFSAKKVTELCTVARIRPAAIQAEMHPCLAQSDLVEECREQRVPVTADSTLGSPDRPHGMRQEGEPVLLDDRDMQHLSTLDRHRRYVDGAFRVFPEGPYTLAKPGDESPSESIRSSVEP